MKQETIVSKHLEDISAILSLHGKSVHDAGLLHGKMGIALFFSHYASFTQEKKYNQLADELIKELGSQILRYYSLNNDNEIFSFSYENGLSGVGIGIEYLVKQGFMKVDLDVFLNNVDILLSKRLTGKTVPVSLMLDIGKYFLIRLSNPQTAKKDFFTQALEQVVQLINNYLRINPLQHPQLFKFMHELSKQYTNPILSSLVNRQFEFIKPEIMKMEERNIVLYDNMIEELLNQPGATILCHNIEMGGLLNGYAGLGLSLLSMLDSRNNSWLNLL